MWIHNKYTSAGAVRSIKKSHAVLLCSWRVLSTSDDGVSLHQFSTDASLAGKCSKAIHVHRAAWIRPSSSSRLCSLHFTSERYNKETVMRKMDLEAKRLNLKEGSIPTCSPSRRTLMVDKMLGGMILFTSSRAVQTKLAQAQEGLLSPLLSRSLPELPRYGSYWYGSMPGCCTLPSGSRFVRSSSHVDRLARL